MIPLLIPSLFIDPQSLPQRQRCRDCGEASFGIRCLRCERRSP